MNQKLGANLDWVLILTLMIQIIVGSAFIYSVSGGLDEYIKVNHRGGLVYFHDYLLALGFSLVTACFAYKYYSSQFVEKYAYWFVGLAFILITGTLIPGVGVEFNETFRSINVGLANVYVVPMTTIFLIVGVSRYIAEHFSNKQAISLSTLRVVGVFFLLSILFYYQPNNKLTAVLVFLLLIISYSVKHYKLCLISTLASLLVFIGIMILTPLFFEKVSCFYSPSKHEIGAGFQLLASLATIGGGDLWGVGFGNGLEKHFYFPDAHKGFMFSSITEQVGAAGSILIILFAAIVLWRSLRLVPHLFISDRIFEGLLVTGFSSWIALLSIFHIAACLGVIPANDIYLPFISYDRAYLFATLLGTVIIIKIGSTVTIANKSKRVKYQPVLIIFLSLFLALGIYTFSKAVLDVELDKQYGKRVIVVRKLMDKFLHDKAELDRKQCNLKNLCASTQKEEVELL